MLSVPFKRYKKKSLIMLVTIQGDPLDEFKKIKYKKFLQVRIIALRRSLVDEKTHKGQKDTVWCLIKLNESKLQVEVGIDPLE